MRISVCRHDERRRFATALTVASSGYAIVASIITLLGWAIGARRLTDWNGCGISMFPIPAGCALLCGLCLLMVQSRAAAARTAVRLVAGVVAIVGALTLLEHVSGINLRLDTLIFYRAWEISAAAAPMRMGPPASVAFVVVGLGLILTTCGRRGRGHAVRCGLATVGIAALSLAGYLYGAQEMYAIPKLTGIAMQTATVILALGIGLISSAPDCNPMWLLQEPGTAGTLARRALPVIVVISLSLGWAVVKINRSGLSDAQFATAARSIVEMSLLAGLLWWAAAMVRQHELALRRSETEVRRQAKQLEAFLETAAIWLHRAGPDGIVLWANEAELCALGYSRQQYIGHPLREFFVNAAAADEMMARLHAGQAVSELEADMKCRDGSIKHVLIDCTALWEEGRFIHTQCFTRDITEQKRASLALRSAKEAAEAATLAKDNFMAALSHELRTPLTPVLATLSAWETADDFPPALRSDMTMVRRNIELEARLIDDLLDLTRIVKGKLVVHPETLDLHSLVESVVRITRGDMTRAGLELSVQLEAKRSLVRADPGRMQQVFWNLLKNAAKFTPAGGAIEIRTWNRPDDRLCVAIRDSGIGISPQMLPRLFKPFEQGNEEMVKRFGGLGLGLTIAKTLLNIQGGEIIAESDGIGRGATFTITLPLTTEPLAPAQAPPPITVPASAMRFRVLLVEDHEDTARILSLLLSKVGHEIELVSSLHEAIGRLQSGEFDLLISDIGLPDGSGLDLIRHVRQRLRRQMPAIALTGYGMEEDVARCKTAGFDEHLTKPVNFQHLQSVIQRVGISATMSAPYGQAPGPVARVEPAIDSTGAWDAEMGPPAGSPGGVSG
jgi:PAS domain S-box-containing protein